MPQPRYPTEVHTLGSYGFQILCQSSSQEAKVANKNELDHSLYSLYSISLSQNIKRTIVYGHHMLPDSPAHAPQYRQQLAQQKYYSLTRLESFETRNCSYFHRSELRRFHLEDGDHSPPSLHKRRPMSPDSV